nr:hypothetical protein [Pseudaminobacter salicylatoxidans]
MVDLGRLVGSDGATWLDRRLVHGETADLARSASGNRYAKPCSSAASIISAGRATLR